MRVASDLVAPVRDPFFFSTAELHIDWVAVADVWSTGSGAAPFISAGGRPR